MEQDKIDLTRATPVPDARRAARPARRGAPLWLQLLLSLVVIVIAVAIAALLLPSANTMLAQTGVTLPLLTGATEQAASAPAAPGAQPQGQAQPQAGTGQRQGGQASQGAQGGGRGGFGAAGRVAVVVAVPATTGTINNKLSAIGEGVAANSVTINTASGGTLMSVAVKPGDHVQAGAKLAMLDSDTQQNAVDKATLAQRDADATLTRTQTLAKTNAVPASQVDTAQLAADNARLALQAAQIALAQRTITTPIAGTVGLIQVSPGNLINAQSVVTTIEDDANILVNFWVPERYSSQIKLGMAVDAQSSALPGRNFAGIVTAIDNKIDPDSRTLQIQATIPNPDAVIKPGMSFSVDMTFPGETFPSVDPLSIQWSNQGAYVWKVAGDKVQKGMVDIIQRNSDGVLVKGDVNPGDLVVTQGVLQLSDGASIRLLDRGPASSGGSGQSADGTGQSAGKGQSAVPQAAGSGGGNGQYKKRQSSASASAASSAAGG